MNYTPITQEEADKLSENELSDLFIAQATQQNSEMYNYLKLAEEANEVSELALKYVTKENNKPTKEQIAEEVGDLMVRLGFLLVDDEFEKLVEARLVQKIKFLVTAPQSELPWKKR